MLVNNEKLLLHEIKQPTIQSLLEHFQLSKNHIVIEYNKTILSKKNYSSVTLNEDDTIEIIHFVGGG